MYIVHIQIKQYKFKRFVKTNDINKCVKEIDNLVKEIGDDYFIEIEPSNVRINKIKYTP